ncbi:hypothetical protein EHE19_015045 [Ruminiclostridium herbifermentans]|uniref:Lipoprotein n=1 Tax=Ruminiclostridium herbifermentans TaxID=2488810 RepID=A0A4U7JJQ6_9FIRM|nr:hypothetical protein [Ruminiclostridium herbifermentans]QNU66183.1 hypothetical protein EHE19_015045 [Ruminiclostridium herbifermentans]
MRKILFLMLAMSILICVGGCSNKKVESVKAKVTDNKLNVNLDFNRVSSVDDYVLTVIEEDGKLKTTFSNPYDLNVLGMPNLEPPSLENLNEGGTIQLSISIKKLKGTVELSILENDEVIQNMLVEDEKNIVNDLKVTPGKYTIRLKLNEAQLQGKFLFVPIK